MREPKLNKLADLQQRKAQLLSRLNARIEEAQRLETHRQRKEETRHKIIVGACLLADIEARPEVKVRLEESLKRTATGKDVEFLKSKGWAL